MTQQSYYHLPIPTILNLKSRFGSRNYERTTVLFYEGQIPNIAFILIKGELLLTKRNKVYKKLTEGIVVGVSELFNRIESRYTVKISAGTSLIPLELSALKELAVTKNFEHGFDFSLLLKNRENRQLFP